MSFKNFKLILVLFIVAVIIFFLETCPPLDQLSFNWWLLGLCVFGIFYGYLAKDYTIVGLFIPILSGFAKLSPYHYPVVSLVSLFVLLGFILSLKFDEKILENYTQNKHIILVVLSFFVINFLSFLFTYIKLIYPGIVYPVNVRGELSFHMIFHVVGYFFLPLVTSFLLFVVNLIFKNEKNTKRFFILLFIGFFLSCVAGILQNLGILKGNFGYVIHWEKRVNGLFSNYNSFALSLSLVIPILIYFLIEEKKLIYKVIVSVLLIVCIINMLFTGTRSALLSLVISLIFIFFVFIKRDILIKIIMLLLLIGVSIFYILRILNEDEYGVKRIFKIDPKIGIEERMIFWTTGLKLFKENILVGNGAKSVYINFYNIHREKHWYLSDNACNTYIQFLAETGIIGTLIFLVITYLIFSLFVLAVKNNVLLRTFISLSLISFLAVSFFGHHLDSEEVSILFWFFVSVGCCSEVFKKRYSIVKKVTFLITGIFFVLTFVSLLRQLLSFDIFRYKYWAGIYDTERRKGIDVCWTDRYALFNVKHFRGKKVIFEFNKDILPSQEVQIFLDSQEYTKLKLETDDWYRVEIPLNQNDFSIIKIKPKIVFYKAGVLRYLFPFIGKDYRRLGVLLSFYEVN